MKLFAYGKILKPHGLNGEVKVLPYSGESENFKKFKQLYLSPNGGSEQEFKITGKKFQKNQIIAKLDGIDSIEKAEELRGLTVYIDRKDLPSTDNDEYYWFELIGLSVFDIENEKIGRVDSIIDNAAQPILVIKNRSDEYMVPFIEKFVKEIDIKNSKIIIEPIEGLL